MSTISQPGRLMPQSISRRISQLRIKVITWLLMDGASKVLLATVLIILLDVGLDRMFRMDLAQRTIMLVLMALVIVGLFCWRLIQPFFFRPNDDSLILEIEAHNKELRESMISSAQLSRVTDAKAVGVSDELMQVAIQSGNEKADSVNISNVMNQSRWGINIGIVIACLLTLGAIAYGVNSTNFWKTWFNRNVLLTNDQWPQNTILKVQNAVNGVILAPRGEDLQVTVIVDEKSRVTDVDVYVERELGDGRSREKTSVTGALDGRERQLTFYDVMDDFRFRATAGYDSTDWVQVKLVDPPIVESVSIAMRLPEYTGVSDPIKFEGGGPYSVFEGSDLIIKGKVNKEINSAKLQNEAGARNFEVDDDLAFSMTIPASGLAGGKFVFELQDDSKFQPSDPASFVIKLKKDDAPKVRANVVGVSSMVTQQAMIPLEFSAEDEFAVTSVQFEYQWSGGENSAGSSGTKPIENLEGLGSPAVASESLQVLDLRDLEIPLEAGLRVLISAKDNNTLYGPSSGNSREFLFRVVSAEELRADLARREVEQRKAFERAIEQEQEIITEMRVMLASLDDKPAPADAETKQQRLDLLLSSQRRQNVVRTNVGRIADQFDGFVVEATNNRLGSAAEKDDSTEADEFINETTNALQERLLERIIKPLIELNQDDGLMAKSGQWLENSSRSLDDNSLLKTQLETSIDFQNQLIKRMRQILAEMIQSEGINDIVADVIKNKRSEEEIKKLIEKAREDAADKDIFDDD